MSTDFCSEIADIISGYRRHDRKKGILDLKINKAHVEKWVSQFGENEDVVLEETCNLLKQCYCPKERVENFLTNLYQHKQIWGDNVPDSIANTCFLNAQEKGNSQNKLYQKSRKIIQRLYDINIADNDGYPPSSFSEFLYLDDGMFTGCTVLNDLQNLYETIHNGTKVIVVFMARHSFAKWWVEQKLAESFPDKKVNLCWGYLLSFQNSGGRNFTYDCLWPKSYDSPLLRTYLQQIDEEHRQKTNNKVRTFRTDAYHSDMYTSDKNREIFEQALMEAGLKIMSFSQDPNSSLRPMGFDNRISFGLGAFFATYMNISNNCPLAFWWGDTSAPSWHPLSKWYPLLPRRINEQEDEYL